MIVDDLIVTWYCHLEAHDVGVGTKSLARGRCVKYVVEVLQRREYLFELLITECTDNEFVAYGSQTRRGLSSSFIAGH